MDPLIVEKTIQVFIDKPCDYASNAHVSSYPMGMAVQVFKLDTLKKSYAMTTDPLDREHVTRHIRNHPDLFTHENLVAPPELFWPDLGVTLDEQKDYDLIKQIIEYFGEQNPCFSCREVIDLLRNVHPEWVELNKDVKRKGMNQ